MNTIKEITSAEAQAIFDSGKDGRREPRGQFIVLEADGTTTAIDNNHGCAWTENFKTREQADFWLADGEVEAQDVEEAMARAEAERCAVCHNGGDEDLFEGQPVYHVFIEADELVVGSPEVVEEDGNIIFERAKINFCPICGRELGGCASE